MAIPNTTVTDYLRNANNLILNIMQDSKLYHVGLVSRVNYQQNFETQRWGCLGVYGSAGITSLGHNASLNIDFFVGAQPSVRPDGSSYTVYDLNYSREKAQENGQPLVIDQIILFDRKYQTNIHTFDTCVLSSISGNIAAGQLVSRNLVFEVLDRK